MKLTSVLFAFCYSLAIFASAEDASLKTYINEFYTSEKLEQKGLKKEPFLYGIVGFHNLKNDGLVGSKSILAILDFSQSSKYQRFYFFDLATKKLVHQTYGTHGKNSGDEYATSFSNVPETNKSSLGFYTTFDESYTGTVGHALRLNGMDIGYNDNAYERAIVFHGATYATAEHVREFGKLGRSWGCPAVPMNEIDMLIELMLDRTVLFIYYPDQTYLKNSRYLNMDVLENTFIDQ